MPQPKFPENLSERQYRACCGVALAVGIALGCAALYFYVCGQAVGIAS